jgi:hypothetical protein
MSTIKEESEKTMDMESERQAKPNKKKKNSIEKIFYDFWRAIVLMITNAIKSFTNLLKVVFELIFLLTNPVKFVITFVQLLKSRAFSTVVLIGSLVIVGWASIDATVLVLKSLYPEWTDTQTKDYAIRILILLESVLVFFKINRKKYLSWFAMFLVLAFTIGSVGYQVFLDSTKFKIGKLILLSVVMGTPTLLSTLLMYFSANEVSKIPKNTKLDKAFRGKKNQRFSMSKEERELLYKQILEHVDHNSDSIESFRGVQEVFQDRCKSSFVISNLLKKERPLLYERIKKKQPKGRKSENEKKAQEKKEESKFFNGIGKRLKKFLESDTQEPDKK